MSETRDDAVLVGGPRDGATLAAQGQPVIEIEIDGLIHRYTTTTKERGEHHVYNYDGVIDPGGAQPGVETPESGSHHPVDGDRLSG